MKVCEKEGVTFLTYPEFDKLPGVVHGFSTRLGGCSEGIYASMNLSFTRGDKEDAVKENYRRISAALGFLPEDIVTSDQTHTANVRVVTEEDRGNGITKSRPYTDVDGMVTNVPGPCWQLFMQIVFLFTWWIRCIRQLDFLIRDGEVRLQESER